MNGGTKASLNDAQKVKKKTEKKPAKIGGFWLFRENLSCIISKALLTFFQAIVGGRELVYNFVCKMSYYSNNVSTRVLQVNPYNFQDCYMLSFLNTISEQLLEHVLLEHCDL